MSGWFALEYADGELEPDPVWIELSEEDVNAIRKGARGSFIDLL